MHTVLCSHRPLSSISNRQRFLSPVLLHKLVLNFMSDQPLKLPSHEEGAVLSSTFEEAILPQYWLTAQREQSLNTGADSWSFRCKSFFFFSSFSSASTQDGTLRNQKLYIKSFSKKPAWRVSLLDLSLISLLLSSSNASPLHSRLTPAPYLFSPLRCAWLRWSYSRTWLLKTAPLPWSL